MVARKKRGKGGRGRERSRERPRERSRERSRDNGVTHNTTQHRKRAQDAVDEQVLLGSSC